MVVVVLLWQSVFCNSANPKLWHSHSDMQLFRCILDTEVRGYSFKYIYLGYSECFETALQSANVERIVPTDGRKEIRLLPPMGRFKVRYYSSAGLRINMRAVSTGHMRVNVTFSTFSMAYSGDSCQNDYMELSEVVKGHQNPEPGGIKYCGNRPIWHHFSSGPGLVFVIVAGGAFPVVIQGFYQPLGNNLIKVMRHTPTPFTPVSIHQDKDNYAEWSSAGGSAVMSHASILNNVASTGEVSYYFLLSAGKGHRVIAAEEGERIQIEYFEGPYMVPEMKLARKLSTSAVKSVGAIMSIKAQTMQSAIQGKLFFCREGIPVEGHTYLLREDDHTTIDVNLACTPIHRITNCFITLRTPSKSLHPKITIVNSMFSNPDIFSCNVYGSVSIYDGNRSGKEIYRFCREDKENMLWSFYGSGQEMTLYVQSYHLVSIQTVLHVTFKAEVTPCKGIWAQCRLAFVRK